MENCCTQKTTPMLYEREGVVFWRNHETYSKRHNKFLFPALAGAIYGSSCKAENEISNVVNYK